MQHKNAFQLRKIVFLAGALVAFILLLGAAPVQANSGCHASAADGQTVIVMFGEPAAMVAYPAPPCPADAAPQNLMPDDDIDPSAVQLVSLETQQPIDDVTFWGVIFVGFLFWTLVLVWLRFLWPRRARPVT